MLSMSTGQQPPADWREGRRLRAWELKQQDWSQQAIADALGVTPGAVSQWMRRAREGGVEALKRRVAPGPTPRLTDEQRAQVPLLLAQGAEAFGFRGDVWTAKRVATVIRREFGVRYHPNHVGNLLRAAGWSVQKPVQRASQRNEAAIEAWRTERWPQLKRHLSVSRGRAGSAEWVHAVSPNRATRGAPALRLARWGESAWRRARAADRRRRRAVA